MKRAVAASLTGVLVVGAAWMVADRRRVEAPALPSRTPIERDTVVFLGDSITAQGAWSVLFAGFDVANEGHPGFTTEQLVPVAQRVAEAGPRRVFVLTGTNDVRDGLPPSVTVSGLDEIRDRFRASSPSTDLVVQTVLPRAATAAAIVDTNRAIVSWAERNELAVVDLHAAFDDGSGGLRPDETTDGWHLDEAGYRRWVDLIRPLVEGED